MPERRMQVTISTAIGAVGAVLLLTVTAAAQPPGWVRDGGPGWRGFGFRQLDLTAEQRDQLREAFGRFREGTRERQEALGTARAALREAVQADTFDEIAIRERAGEVAAIEADATVERARLHTTIRDLLTPEQRERMERIRSNWQPRRSDWRERRLDRRERRLEKRERRFDRRERRHGRRG